MARKQEGNEDIDSSTFTSNIQVNTKHKDSNNITNNNNIIISPAGLVSKCGHPISEIDLTGLENSAQMLMSDPRILTNIHFSNFRAKIVLLK